MSQATLSKFALTTTEATLITSTPGAEIYLKSIYLSNASGGTVTVNLAITIGGKAATVGDWIIYGKSIAAGDYLYLENVFIPENATLRGSASAADSISLMATGLQA